MILGQRNACMRGIGKNVLDAKITKNEITFATIVLRQVKRSSRIQWRRKPKSESRRRNKHTRKRSCQVALFLQGKGFYITLKNSNYSYHSDCCSHSSFKLIKFSIWLRAQTNYVLKYSCLRKKESAWYLFSDITSLWCKRSSPKIVKSMFCSNFCNNHRSKTIFCEMKADIDSTSHVTLCSTKNWCFHDFGKKPVMKKIFSSYI